MSLRVFVVTGGNKGIGKSIVKLLLQDKTEKIVYLTSRNEELGQKAVKDLEDSFGLKAKYHQLDITDQKSIDKLRDYFVETYGGLDVLINNAGIAFRGDSPHHGALSTVGCNFFGTLNVCKTLLSNVKDNGCVVHVSSISSSHVFKKLSNSLKERLSNPTLSIDGKRDLFTCLLFFLIFQASLKFYSTVVNFKESFFHHLRVLTELYSSRCLE